MSLLEKPFVAISCDGKYYSFNDVEAWILDFGVDEFSAQFGIDYGFISIDDYISANEFHRSSKYHIHHKRGRCSHAFIIQDMSGKNVNPDCILADFYLKHPGRRPVCQVYSGFGFKRTRYRSYRRLRGFHRLLKEYHSIICEDGEPPLKRDLCPNIIFGDDISRKYEKSWKKFRKTQYKNSDL